MSAIEIFQDSYMEDCDMEIEKLQSELERVKQIARDRLDTIQNLRHTVAVLEDKLEDTRSDVRYIQEATGRALTR
jgi:chromosome segregation ATPase